MTISPEDLRELVDALKAGIRHLDMPPSVQSINNIRAIDAMDSAAAELLALRAKMEVAQNLADRLRIICDQEAKPEYNGRYAVLCLSIGLSREALAAWEAAQ